MAMERTARPAWRGIGGGFQGLQIVCAVLLLALGLSGMAMAQAQYSWETFEKRVSSANSVQALGNDMFGDAVSLQNGALSFTVTDVSLPGNSALPVQFTRTYAVQNRRGTGSNEMLADWLPQLPRLTGTFATDWVVQGTSTSRCSNTAGPTVPTQYIQHFTLADYWQGIQVELPGGGGGELLLSNTNLTKPADGRTYLWTTPSGQTQLACLSTIKNGTGEGFVAITPDGTKYYFDWMAQRPIPGLDERIQEPGGGITYNVTMPLRENSLYATRVEDRYGNWVEYTYSNAWNAPAKLTKILANDGRQLTFSYGTNAKISTVNDGTRTWTYGYGTDNSPNGRTSLNSVTLPDSRQWLINFASLSHSPFDYTATESTRGCEWLEWPQNWGQEPVGIITHPSGAVGTFRVGMVEHGRSNVTVSCSRVTTYPVGAPPGTNNDPTDDEPLFVISSWNWSLLSKQISGPGISPQVWNYSYESDIWGHYYPGTTGTFPVCFGTQCFQPACTNDACAGTARTLVTAPDGSWRRYVFGNSWQYNEGKLLRIETGTAGGAVLETTTHSYDLLRTDKSYPARYGTSLRINVDGFDAEYHRPLLGTSTARDSTTFNWQINTCGSSPCLDAWARPTNVSRSSSNGHSKTESTTYADHTGKWVLGQVASVSVNGITASRATYDPATANLKQVFGFGDQLQQTLTYNPDGTVATITDGRNSTTTLGNWYRGVPRLITFPDTTTISAVVDAKGWIGSTTDQLGYVTSYGYDAMGRLKTLTPPSGDSLAWAPTTVDFVPVAAAEYGIAAGHWRRTESRGNYRKITYYDALWRPVIEREYDNANASGTERFRGWKYDHDGRVTFDGYPLASTTALTIASFGSNGVTSSYDALGRPLTVSQSSELGALTTSYAYLAGFQTRVTNPRGYATTTSYQAFDSPDTANPVLIQAPEGVTTTIARDIFGKPLSVTRAGSYGGTLVSATRSYVYDANQRLCKRIEPETGATLFDYDGANNLAWSAEGTALTGLTCDRASVVSSAKVLRSYDAMNRVTLVDYPGSTADISYSYELDGALKILGSGTSTWTYTYNRLRLPTSETLVVDGRAFGSTRSYNSLGYRVKQGYPVGADVVYTLNALGQATRVSSTTDYASAITYYPNGAIKGFTYGNGIVRTLSQNSRGLPMRAYEIKSGSPAVLDDNYAYDRNGNVTDITDGVPGGVSSRGMGYDGLDRLTQAVAPNQWGTASYAYDPLDNLRSADLGARQYRYNYNAANNRLTDIKTPGGALQFAFGYNTKGDTTGKNGSVYTFDAAHRLTAVPNVATYSYDGHGRRVRETPSGGVAQYQVYTMDGQRVLTDSSGSGVRLVYLGNTLLALDAFSGTVLGTRTYLHTDALGSVAVRTDASGGIIRRLPYAPYGELFGSTVDGIGYTGHDMDLNTGLIYMQQRYYDPMIGRFLSADPVAADSNTGGNFNRYWYANNNPYKFTDPDGRIPVETVWDAANVAMGVASFGKNVATGNYVGAAVDAVGVVVDAAATVTPYVPGGAGTAIKAARGADAVVDAAKAGRRAPTASQREAALQRSKGPDGKESCTYCGTQLDRKSGRPNSAEIDHKQAYSKGGKTEDANLDAACRTCNRSKGSKELGTEWVPPKDRK